MSTKTINKLEEQLQILKRKLNDERKKLELRKKLLVGTAFLKAVEDNKIKPEVMSSMLNQYIKRPQDREIVGLIGIPEKSESNNNQVNGQQNSEHQHGY